MTEREIMVWPSKDAKKTGGPGAGAYVRPWAATALMVPAGWAAHALWGDAGLVTAGVTAGITAAGGAVSTLSYHLTRARTWYACLMATATTGAGTVWMAAATAMGTGRPVLDGLVVVGGALSILSNVHTWQRGMTPANGNGGFFDKPVPSWADVAETVGLKGTTLRVDEETEVRTTGIVQLIPGRQTVSDLRHRLEEIASAYRTGPGSIRVQPDPDDSSRARLTVVRRDVLRDAVDWPGLNPDEVGASLTDAPLSLGLYEDGVVFTDDLFDHHTLTVGMSGSGKSVYGKTKAVSIAARADAVVIAVDLAKGRQTLGPISKAILWPAYEKRDAKAVLAALHRAVKARANHLSTRGLDNWERGCGLTFLHVLLEEAAELVEVEALVDLMRVARSTGMHIEASLQRATWTNLDTDARANFGSRICLGTADERDAGFVLPDYVTDSGAAPDQWADRQQGCAYAAVKSQPVDRHAVPIRFYRATNEQLTAAAEACGDQDAKLDSVTRQAFGDAYEQYLTARDRGQTTGAQDQQQEQPVADDMTDDDQEQPVTYTTPDPDPEISASIDDVIEVPLGGGFDIPKPAPKPRSRAAAAQSRALLDTQLEAWERVGKVEFTRAELSAALKGHGVVHDRSWYIRQIQRLEQDGRIRYIDSGDSVTYEILVTEAALV